MRVAAIVLIVCVILPGVVARCSPDDDAGRCGLLSDTTETFMDGMPYCWSTHHMGSLKVLVVFAKDTCDTYDPPPTNYCWKGWTLADTMPQFAADLIVPDTIPADFPVKSLNDYYWTMSSGKYYIYGDYYPQMVVTEGYNPKLWTGRRKGVSFCKKKTLLYAGRKDTPYEEGYTGRGNRSRWKLIEECIGRDRA